MNYNTNLPKSNCDYDEDPDPDLLRKSGLTDEDLRKLRDSFITPALALRAGLQRFDDLAGADLVGRKPSAHQNYSGVGFPFCWPGNSYPREWSLRLDHPLTETKNGKRKEKAKYLGPPGKPPMFFFPPDVDLAWLEDTTMPILFVEGEKKCLAMWLLAWLSASGYLPHFIPIGLRGIWGWKGTNGRAPLPSGKHEPAKGPITDFDRIKWLNRPCFILYDSNVHTNPDVCLARDTLADHLMRLGAQVMVAELPEGCEVNGPDDYAARYGPEAIFRILGEARPAADKNFRRENYAFRDWAVLSDLYNLMTSEWGWDDADKNTYSAINSSWGGRMAKIFRKLYIAIYQRLQKLEDYPAQSDKDKAERFVRDRIRKLKATIERTVNFPLLEKLESGGRIDPQTGRRLPSKFRVNHTPFQRAYRLYLELVEESGNPGQAREVAAKIIAREYAIADGSVIRDEHQAGLEVEQEAAISDFYKKQLNFEKRLMQMAKDQLHAMREKRWSRFEIKSYFKAWGERLAAIGEAYFDGGWREDLEDDAAGAEPMMGTAQSPDGGQTAQPEFHPPVEQPQTNHQDAGDNEKIMGTLQRTHNAPEASHAGRGESQNVQVRPSRGNCPLSSIPSHNMERGDASKSSPGKACAHCGGPRDGPLEYCADCLQKALEKYTGPEYAGSAPT